MFELRVITSLARINWLAWNFGARKNLVSVFHQLTGFQGAPCKKVCLEPGTCDLLPKIGASYQIAVFKLQLGAWFLDVEQHQLVHFDFVFHNF